MTLPAREWMTFAAPDARQTVCARDAILYAVSTGYATAPADPAHLRYLWEDGLEPAPTLANVVAHPGPWMKATGVDWTRVVHAEQRLTIHRPIPLDTPLVSRSRMLAVVDHGQDKALFATFERTLSAEGLEAPIATIIQTNACLGDGGRSGSAGEPLTPLPAIPAQGPDARLTLTIPPAAAVLYRLNGDLNPLHIDPHLAARGGFARPILHGLCTFGYAAYAVSRILGGDSFIQLRSIAARFSAPAFPGEPLDVEVWPDADRVRFRVTAAERDAIVLDRGVAELA